jgi:hypothetical protein
MQVQKVDLKEVYQFKQVVSVNGQESEIQGKLDFNRKNGNIKATVQLTTKQLDIINEEPTAKSLQVARDVLQAAVVKGIELRLDYLQAQAEGEDPDQISMLEQSDFIADTGMIPAKKKKRTSKKPAPKVELKQFATLGGPPSIEEGK